MIRILLHVQLLQWKNPSGYLQVYTILKHKNLLNVYYEIMQTDSPAKKSYSSMRNWDKTTKLDTWWTNSW